MRHLRAARGQQLDILSRAIGPVRAHEIEGPVQHARRSLAATGSGGALARCVTSLGAVDDIEAAITEGLRCSGMRETQREMIRAHIDAPPDPTTCCGSSGAPCVFTLAGGGPGAGRVLGREARGREE